MCGGDAGAVVVQEVAFWGHVFCWHGAEAERRGRP